MTPKTGTSKQNYHQAALTSASQIHKNLNTPIESFAPEEGYVYRNAIEPIPARQRSALKLQWAEKFGATHVVDSTENDPVEFVRDLTQGRGADTAIEAAGQNISIRPTLEASRPDARGVILGKTPYGEEVSFPFHLMMGEREIVNRAYLLRDESAAR